MRSDNKFDPEKLYVNEHTEEHRKQNHTIELLHTESEKRQNHT